MMADSATPLGALDLYRRYITLHATAAGLKWDGDGAEIQRISREADEIAKQLGLRGPSSEFMSGLYRDGETICAVWTVGRVDPWPFTLRALDFLAREVEQATSFGAVSSIQGLAVALGPAIVDPMFDLVADMWTSMRWETRRFETYVTDEVTGEDQEIYAPAGDEADDRFCEAPMLKCEPTARCATLITIADLDSDALETITELVEARDRLARRALRGELA